MSEERFYDAKGIPIYPGDLIRSYHFTGARRKKYYLYHVAVEEAGVMFMVPTAHLQPELVKGGGRCHMEYGLRGESAEIISGHGPGRGVSFEDRPRKKPTAGDAWPGKGE